MDFVSALLWRPLREKHLFNDLKWSVRGEASFCEGRDDDQRCGSFARDLSDEGTVRWPDKEADSEAPWGPCSTQNYLCSLGNVC